MQLHIYGNNSFDSMNILLHLMMSILPFKNNIESQIIFENDLLDINLKKKVESFIFSFIFIILTTYFNIKNN